MARSSSSKRWLREHADDPYVKKAAVDGYRSRAAYKLIELDRRDRLLRPGQRVIDLGAAPGGWSQVARQRVGSAGRVVACDLLAMDPIPGVTFICGDFNDVAVLEAVLEASGGGADIVLSDMAPNISGIKAADQARSIGLAELALDCAGRTLAPGGAMLVKVFQGEGLDGLVAEIKLRFARVLHRKPDASRGRSAELYLLAQGYGI
ncbi:MAG: RlmE family RNA methyltransferase [Gammaproteobacteria bacterium]